MKIFRRKSPKEANKHKRKSHRAFAESDAQTPQRELRNETSNDIPQIDELVPSVEESTSTEETSSSSQEITATILIGDHDTATSATSAYGDHGRVKHKITARRAGSKNSPDAPAYAIEQSLSKQTDIIAGVLAAESVHDESMHDESVKRKPGPSADADEFLSQNPGNVQITEVQNQEHSRPTQISRPHETNLKGPVARVSSTPQSQKTGPLLKPNIQMNLASNGEKEECSHQGETNNPGEIHLTDSVAKATSTPKSQTKSTFLKFLRKGSAKKGETSRSVEAEVDDTLNTTMDTSALSVCSSDNGESRDKKQIPPRSGPVEIEHLNLSKLIRQKNTPMKTRTKQPEYTPLKANRARPPPMSMSKRNEEHFQKYVKRQNIGRKVRVLHQTKAF